MPDAREQIKRVDNLDQKEDKKVSLVVGKEKELTETYVTKTEELLSKADELDNNDPGKQKVKDGTAQLLGEIDEKTLVEKQSEFDKQINGFIDEVEGEKSEEEEFKRIEPEIEDAFASAGVQVDMSKFRNYYKELSELEKPPLDVLKDDMIDFAAQLKEYEDTSHLISEEEINKIFNFYIRGEVEMAANERQKVEEVLKLDEYKKTLEKAEAEDAEATGKLLSATRENADGLALDAVKTKLGIVEALRPFVKLRKLADEGISDSIFDEVKGFSFSVLSGKQDGSLEVVREFSGFPKTESELEAMKTGFEQDLKKAGEIAFIKTGKEEFRAYARAVMAERMAEAEKTNNEKLTKYAKALNRITQWEQFSSQFNVAKRLAEELDAEVKSDGGENKEYLSKIKEYRAEAYRFLNTILQGDQVLDFQKKSMGFVQDTQLFMENSGKMIGEIQEKGEVPSEYFWQHVREYSKETLKKIPRLTPTMQRFRDLAPLEGDGDEIKAINKKIEELKKLYDEIGKYVEEVRQICLIQMKIEGSGMGISGFLNVVAILTVKITIAVAAAVAIGAAIAATGGVAAFGLTGFAAVAGNFFLSNVLIAVGTTTASHLTDFAFEGADASQGIWEDTKNFGSSTLTSLAFSAGGGAIGNVAGKAIGRGYGELLKRIPEEAAMQADKIVSGLFKSAQEGFKEGGKQAFGTIWGRALHGIKEIGKETTEEIMEESLDAIGKGLVAQNDDTSQWVGFMFQLIPQIVSGGKGGIESVRVEGKIGNVSIKTSETGMSLEYSSEKDLVNFCEGRAVPVELLKRVQAGETTFTIEKNGVTIEIKKIGGQTIGGKEVSKYEGIITDSDGKIIGYDANKPPQELADAAIAEGKQVYYDNETGDLHIGEIEIRRMETDATAVPKQKPLDVDSKILGKSIPKETIDAITSNPDYTPEQIINEFKKDPYLREQLEASSGTWEGYTIEQHVLMAMKQFEKYYGDKELPAGTNKNLFRVMIAMHDIGKAEAVKRGKPELQHDITWALVGPTLKNMGYSDFEASVILSVIDADFVGKYLKGEMTVEEVKSELLFRALQIEDRFPDSKIKPADLLALMEVFHKVDAGSYTEDAGGARSLDGLFDFEKSANGISYNENLEAKMRLLRISAAEGSKEDLQIFIKQDLRNYNEGERTRIIWMMTRTMPQEVIFNPPGHGVMIKFGEFDGQYSENFLRKIGATENEISDFKEHGMVEVDMNGETLTVNKMNETEMMDFNTFDRLREMTGGKTVGIWENGKRINEGVAEDYTEPARQELPVLDKFLQDPSYDFEKLFGELAGTREGKSLLLKTAKGEVTALTKFIYGLKSAKLEQDATKAEIEKTKTAEEIEEMRLLAQEMRTFTEREYRMYGDFNTGTSSLVLPRALEAGGKLLSSQALKNQGIARVEGEGSTKGGDEFQDDVFGAEKFAGIGVALSYAETTENMSTNNMTDQEIRAELDVIARVEAKVDRYNLSEILPRSVDKISEGFDRTGREFAKQRLKERKLKLETALRNREFGIDIDAVPVVLSIKGEGLVMSKRELKKGRNYTGGALSGETSVRNEINLKTNLERVFVPREHVEEAKKWVQQIDPEGIRGIGVYSLELLDAFIENSPAKKTYEATNYGVQKSKIKEQNKYMPDLYNLVQ